MKKNINKNKGDELWDYLTEYPNSIISNKIIIDGKDINYMLRDSPSIENNDNGWLFLCGEEDDDYLNNPNNVSVFSIFTIAKNEPNIIPFLDSDIGTTFEKDKKTGKFIEIFYHTGEKTYE